MPNLSGRMARWVEQMAEYHCEIEHIPGKLNDVADALSRRADLAAIVQRSDKGGAVPPRGILKKSVSFESPNPFDALGAVRVHPPESAEQRQRNIDAATKVTWPAHGLPPPGKTGTIVTPTQRCAADTNSGRQCAQRTAVAHLCWNHLRRDLGLRVQLSSVAGAGRGLFAARPQGLPAGHRVPYTGDLIARRPLRTGDKTRRGHRRGAAQRRPRPLGE